jgi:hypothetical protein
MKQESWLRISITLLIIAYISSITTIALSIIRNEWFFFFLGFIVLIVSIIHTVWHIENCSQKTGKVKE